VSKANKSKPNKVRFRNKKCSFTLTFFIVMSSLFLILLCCLGALIIHLWFYSDFAAYYVRTFKILIPVKIYNWLLIDEYLNNQDPDLFFDSYIEYLFVKRSFTKSFKTKFFLKLFSCITCFTVWISIIISVIYGNMMYVGLIFILLRLLDYILRFVLKKKI
jgi:hypothetical protein